MPSAFLDEPLQQASFADCRFRLKTDRMFRLNFDHLLMIRRC
jgi:hypothetical protein